MYHVHIFDSVKENGGTFASLFFCCWCYVLCSGMY